MDLSVFANPYDFANPVTHPDMFFGRSDEMAEIRYYLDHAKTADRPINIALLGDRAAGKTSILNMTEIEARARGCCTARIDLDEDDANSQMLFFYKVFDGIFSAACQLGAFGGLTGKTYSTYLATVSSLIVPEEQLFCPFLFPIQFALAMKSGNTRAPVSDHAVKHDLALIIGELKRPMVVLFDESNVLAQSRVLLEKIRNIFMNISGYMLVLTGTPDLFPIMDDVFSPIVRQFKKITVKQFVKDDETENCVRKPLQKFSIPVEVSRSEVRDIRELSGGRPYEIQLICHLLFRRIQTKRASRMRLDLAVLEELRRELERSQDMSGRKVLSAVMGLGRKQLQALGVLTGCDRNATFDELWNLNYAFEGTGLFTRNQLEAEFETLKSKGILTEEDGKVAFSGDSFDSLYIKYVAAEQKIRIAIHPVSVELALLFGLMQFILPVESFNVNFGTDAWTARETAAKLLTSEDPTSDPFAEGQEVTDDVYFQMIDFRKKGEIPSLFVSVSLGGETTAALVSPTAAKEESLEKLKRNLGPVKLRLENVGGGLTIEKRILPTSSVERLSEKVRRTENQERRKRIARMHTGKLAQFWLEQQMEDASMHAALAYTYDQSLGGTAANNLGYFFLATGELDKAEELLRRAVDTTGGDPATKALATFNLAMLKAERQQESAALQLLDECSAILSGIPDSNKRAGCIRVPERVASGSLIFRELSEPDLSKESLRAASTLRGGQRTNATAEVVT
jgi:hypothetical protein